MLNESVHANNASPVNQEAEERFYGKIHFWGRISLCIGLVMSLAFPSYMSFVKGYHPGWAVIGSGLVGVAAVIGHTWVNVADVLTNVIIMGPAGTYMSSLTGNIKNMRMPSAIAAQSAIKAEHGTIKAEIAGMLGIAASIIVNTVSLIILVVAGTFIIQVLPEFITSAFTYVLPALFGGVFAQFAIYRFSSAIVAIVVALPTILFINLPDYLKTPLAIFLTIAITLLIDKYKAKNND